MSDSGVSELCRERLYYWNGAFGDLDDDEYFMECGDSSRENPDLVAVTITNNRVKGYPLDYASTSYTDKNR